MDNTNENSDFMNYYHSMDESLKKSDIIMERKQKVISAEVAQKKEKRKAFWAKAVILIPTIALIYQMVNVAVSNYRVSEMAKVLTPITFVQNANYRGAASSIAYAGKESDSQALVFSYFKEFNYDEKAMDQIFNFVYGFVNGDVSLQTPEVRMTIGYDSFSNYLHGNGFDSTHDFIKWGEKLLKAYGIDDAEKRNNLIAQYIAIVNEQQDEIRGVNRNG